MIQFNSDTPVRVDPHDSFHILNLIFPLAFGDVVSSNRLAPTEVAVFILHSAIFYFSCPSHSMYCMVQGLFWRIYSLKWS